MCRAEALLKLHQIDDAESCISWIPKSKPHPGFPRLIASSLELRLRWLLEGEFRNCKLHQKSNLEKVSVAE